MLLETVGRAVAVLCLSGCIASTATPIATARPAPLPGELERKVIARALSGLERHLRPRAPYCLALAIAGNSVDADGALIGELTLQHEVVALSACPPTYASMVRVVDSLGRDLSPARPPGYVDPYHLAVTPPVAVTEQLAVVRIEVGQGTRGWLYYCEVSIALLGPGLCARASEWIS